MITLATESSITSNSSSMSSTDSSSRSDTGACGSFSTSNIVITLTIDSSSSSNTRACGSLCTGTSSSNMLVHALIFVLARVVSSNSSTINTTDHSGSSDKVDAVAYILSIVVLVL